MQPQITEIVEHDTDEVRRTVHNVAAAIISVRALAETLAEHVPTLVAISRCRSNATQAHIPPETLDAIPAIPGEIVKLCEIAREALQAVGSESRVTNKISVRAISGARRHVTCSPDSSNSRVGSSKGAQILLVEDDERMRYVLMHRLEAQGHKITTSAYGEEALRLLDKSDYDLILMDLRLPGMSGWETTKRLREKESKLGRYTHIVGLTASPMLQDHTRAKVVGMDEVLVKPVDNNALQSILQRYT